MKLTVVIESREPLSDAELDLLIIRAAGMVRTDIVDLSDNTRTFTHAKTLCNVHFELEEVTA